ncbi:MAG: DUF1540 domain-containing protein [Clostridia bacterium]
MTIICHATGCRFNTRHECSLMRIQVGPTNVPVPPAVLGATSSAYDGQLRAGYATEFEAYTDYAAQQAEEFRDGAACVSYSALTP